MERRAKVNEIRPFQQSEHRLVSSGDRPVTILQKLRKMPALFWATVVAPTVTAILYFGLFASDVYVSESRFVVRSPDQPAVTGLGMLLKTTGFSTSSDQIYATRDFLNSRDALSAINRGEAFRNSYSRPSISIFDRFNGLGLGSSHEDLFKYYRRKVVIDYDTATSITTLTVKAFNAPDARKFNEQLLRMAEQTVNQMSDRGRRDLINVAEAEVNEAQNGAGQAAVALSAYRNRMGIIDPERQATVQVQMISKLQDELISTRTQLIQLRALASGNPQIPALVAQERSLSREIEDQLNQVAGNKGSLAAVAVEYQRLSLESEFASKRLASALASLEEARSEARRKRAYVERIVQPNVPDYPLEPRRLKGVFTTFILGLIAWGILSMLLAGMLEHRD